MKICLNELPKNSEVINPSDFKISQISCKISVIIKKYDITPKCIKKKFSYKPITLKYYGQYQLKFEL